MRKSLALLTVVLAILFIATGCKNKPPLTPVRPSGPDSVALNVEATFTSWTTDPNRDAIRYVFDWGYDDMFDTSGYLPSGDTIAMAHVWSMVGTYELRVRAQDENGNWSVDWSDIKEVFVYPHGDNNPPNPPSRPEGPDSVELGALATFSSSALDPDGDSVQIRFYWGDELISAWSDWVPSGTAISDTVRYQFRGAKQVRAVARDTRGDTSALSEPATIVVYGENNPPDKPVLTGPARGAKDGPMYLFFARARDPEGDNLEYKFFWGDGRESNWTAARPHDTPVPDSVRYTAEGVYNIRCIARDVDGAISDTSDPLRFEVVGEGRILWAVSTDECVASPAWAAVQTPLGLTRPAVVIGNTEGRMIAVDAWQGTELYSSFIATEAFHSSPAVSADWNTVYIGNANGQMFALNNTGGEKWERPWPDSVTELDFGATPVVDGDHIYCAGEAGFVYKLRDTGSGATLVWSFETRDDIYASPVLAGGRLIVADDSGYVYFLNPDNGSKIAEFFCDGGIIASPAVAANGNIYVGTDQGTMYAISPAGAEVWSYTITPFAQIIGSPVVSTDGGVVFGADNGLLYKLNPGTGIPVVGWPFELTTADLVSTPAVCADGIIYVVSDDDRLHAIRENGTRHWPTPVELVLPGMAGRGRGRSPRGLSTETLSPSVMVDQYGIIYAASGLDGLFAIAGRGEAGRLASTSWPMFQHDVRHSGKAGSW